MNQKSICDSRYGSLVFPPDAEDLYTCFKREEQLLYKKYYEKLKERYGFWAGNQDKYVESVEDLNSLDSWPHPLEMVL